MSAPEGLPTSDGYGAQLVAATWQPLVRLARPPQAPPAADGGRHLRRQLVLLNGVGLIAILLLMVGFDATEIGMMPARGTPSLWWVRILTDFGKDAYVLSLLGAAVVAVPAIAPLWPQASRARLFDLSTHVQYLFLAVLVPVACSEVLKWGIGRGRPFVGGKANAFNFQPFNGTEAYFSLPSSHAVTGFALAFAVAAIWPRLTVPMCLYALAIAGSRLVLLAHHPSDVVAGALVGISGALVARYWFAARQLGFAIGPGGRIVSGPSRLKGVDSRAPAP
ncbi:phosphatase PAP2 family protein [Bradyrhizobium sp. STM 3557]|uniref:phosphatase PAP2 family protein n=1 Tax=Bradyrhizobium sp. STM 3557 TaxID=578920 RepID=UPI00388E6E92